MIGLGHIAQNAVLPAFRHAEGACEITALVSGNPLKLRELSRRYQVPHAWTYEDFDEAIHGDLFDAVYIALPNHLHHEFTVRAAMAGKHVLCEKPMALSVRECDDMIRTARHHNVRLMIAYRLHFDPVNLRAIEVARSGELGQLHAFVSSFATPREQGDIRVRRETGGGTLWDIGIYCINAARNLFRAEPVEAFGWASDVHRPRFREVAEMTVGTLRFPGGKLAQFWSSFASADVSNYSLIGSKGRLHIEQAYEYHEPRETTLTLGERIRRRHDPVNDQFAPELIYFADCVRRHAEPVPDGIEGRSDVAVIEALYESIRTGRPVPLGEEGPGRRPDPGMAMARPPVRGQPDLVAVRQH